MKKESLVVSGLIAFFLICIGLGVYQTSLLKKPDPGSEPFMLQKNGIGLIHIDGTISSSMRSSGMALSGIEAVIDNLSEFEKDKRIRAVVLRINSAGGAAGSSQELFNEILKFKERSKLPVIASIADIGASGAYWIALASDTIFANPGSTVGSIGVIISSYDLTEFGNKYGIGLNVIKSGEFKDSLSSWRKVTADDKHLFNNLVKNVHKQFVASLVEQRKLDPAQALALADGRLFTGEQAGKLGLIDELGGLQDAIDFAADKAGITAKPQVIIKTINPMQQFLQMWLQYSETSVFNMFSEAMLTVR
ncbi:signal peptide peptidase SppA [Thermoproteota archaeon]